MNLPEPDKNKHTPKDTARTWVVGDMADSTTTLQRIQIERLSPIALAYVGDAVYELYVRTKFLLPPKRMTDYSSQVVTQVRAESQAIHLAQLIPHLTAREREILRRGRNACKSKPRRLSRHIYKQATGLETLIGYLHLTDPRRLEELLAYLDFSQTADPS